MKIKLKVTNIDTRNNTIFLKFASENSKHDIDYYDDIGFSIFATTHTHKTVQEYIDSIKQNIYEYVKVRDAAEKTQGVVEYDSWVGYSSEINITEQEVDPYGPDHLAPGLTKSEVEL